MLSSGRPPPPRSSTRPTIIMIRKVDEFDDVFDVDICIGDCNLIEREITQFQNPQLSKVKEALAALTG